MFTRRRRLRRNFLTRELVKNISIETSSLIYPLFICDGENIKSEIESMPEQYRYSLDRLNEELDELLKLGINNILLFGIPNHKDEIGSQAYNENGIVQRAVRQIRKDYQDKFLIVTDVCMCEYTSHGHCGILHNHDVDNDETLEYIAKIALSHAKAGADIIAPSDMMDGRIAKIREVLDKNNYKDILTEEDIGSLFSESEFKQQVENISEIRLNINIIWIISSIVLIFLTVFALYKKYV